MSSHTELGRISWLSAALSTQRHRIMHLLGRIGDLGVANTAKPALFHKFLNLMSQVAVAKDEETRILSSIESIEQKHRFSRKHGKLAHPKEKLRDGNMVLNSYSAEEDAEYEAYCREYHLCDEPVHDEDVCDQGLYIPDAGVVPERPRYGWLWLLAFWYLMTSKGISNSKQELNPD